MCTDNNVVAPFGQNEDDQFPKRLLISLKPIQMVQTHISKHLLHYYDD